MVALTTRPHIVTPLLPISPQVEVLGVKDESGEIRMVGFEPCIKNRIRAVVSAVQDWVLSDTSLLLDHSISPQPFRAHFQQVANAPPASKDISGNIMHYLRRNMPRMFQVRMGWRPAADWRDPLCANIIIGLVKEQCRTSDLGAK